MDIEENGPWRDFACIEYLAGLSGSASPHCHQDQEPPKFLRLSVPETVKPVDTTRSSAPAGRKLQFATLAAKSGHIQISVLLTGICV